MTPFEQFEERTASGPRLGEGDIYRMAAIMRRVRGYSDGKQYTFFRALLEITGVRDILMLGVYHGRDIAFMRDCLEQANRFEVSITGVDKFSDTPCADWPEGSAGKKWEDAGFGPPPSLAQATENCGYFLPGRPVTLVESDDADFLATTSRKFDAVYLDTSHDEATVRRQLQQVPRVCRPGAIICGDDYSDDSNAPGGNWGVKRAVSDSFTRHIVFAGWIWVSALDLLKTQNT